MLIKSAELIWKQYLHGVICIYKPPSKLLQVRHCLLSKIADDLNNLEVRQQKKYVKIRGDTTQPLHMAVEPNYADNPLVAGPRYIPRDIKCKSAKNLGEKITGVCVMGINKGNYEIFQLEECNSVSTYHVTGKFGVKTESNFEDGHVVCKCNYTQLVKERIDRSVASIQAIYKQNLIRISGFHPQSQEAYEYIESGIVRPVTNNMPVVYSIKCIDWKLPHFTLEVVCANEDQQFLTDLAAEVGFRNKNLAVASSIRCVRHSFFSIEDALLRKHWTLQNILDNMELCRKRLQMNADYTKYLKKVEEDKREKRVENVNDMEKDYEDEVVENVSDMKS